MSDPQVALVMLALFRRRLGGFNDASVWATLAKAALAALGMGALTGGALLAVRAVGLPDGIAAHAASVAAPGAVGVLAYFTLAARLNLSEARLALNLIRRRLGV
ncbi:MAG: hypothetical protein ACOY4U_00810 [Pseudomonadota bacterium]